MSERNDQAFREKLTILKCPSEVIERLLATHDPDKLSAVIGRAERHQGDDFWANFPEHD